VTAEDPEFIVGTGSYAAKLDYRPDIAPSGQPCDLAIAQKFLSEK